MGRLCKVCSSPRRENIDVELVGGESAAAIAKRYRLSVDSVRRHKGAHLSPALTRVAVDHLRDESARNAFDATGPRLDRLTDRLEEFLSVAEERKSLIGAANLAREIRQCLELSARLQGELNDRPQNVTVNVLSTPEFASMTARLIEALLPWPEARIAAADVLDAEEIAS